MTASSGLHKGPVEGTPADVLTSWAQAEFLPWMSAPPVQGDLAARIDDYALADPSVARYSIEDGRVFWRPKSEAVTQAQFLDPVVRATITARGRDYERFFQDVVDIFGIRGRAELAVNIGDMADHHSVFPIFSFQKRRGSANLLIPDCDFLTWSYYLDARYNDPHAVDDKLDSAVFVGSTTGYLPIYREMVEKLDHQRLRSAVFFKGHPYVSYTLPIICQCDGTETEQLIADLAIGGPHVNWHDQLAHKFIISTDGNGATCSRVAIALKSNSVLIKYNSDNILHYHRGLQPYGNYVAVRDDRDVDYVVRKLIQDRPAFQRIAEQSNTFYNEHLTRPALRFYTRHLLEQYIAHYGEPEAAAPLPNPASGLMIDAYAHVEGVGDVWADPQGVVGLTDEGRVIEGFELQPDPRILGRDLSYRCVGMNGVVSADVGAWQYCGSRGQAKGLRGFYVTLAGASAEAYDLRYVATFSDGSASPVCASGQPCVSATGAPLSSFRIMIQSRT